MAVYIHMFENENSFQGAYNGEGYLEPWVSLTTDQVVAEHVDYNKRPAGVIVKTITLNIGETGGDTVITGYTLEDVTEYFDAEVPFEDVMEPAFEANGEGYDKYIRLSVYDIDPEDVADLSYFNDGNAAVNAFGYGAVCGYHMTNEYMTWKQDALYDGYEFSEDAVGRVITVVKNDMMC